jgi:hypothetical protein
MTIHNQIQLIISTLILLVMSVVAALAATREAVNQQDDDTRRGAIQAVFELDTIVQLPVAFDFEYRNLVAQSNGCAVVSVLHGSDSSGLVEKLLRIRLATFVVDTLEEVISGSISREGTDTIRRGSLNAISMSSDNLACMFESTVVVYRVVDNGLIKLSDFVFTEGYDDLMWLNDSLLVLHHSSYTHTDYAGSYDEIELLNVFSGTTVRVELPDSEAAIFRLMKPFRSLMAAKGTLFYLRPTDGVLMRLNADSSWSSVSGGHGRINEELRSFARRGNSREVRDLQSHSVLATIDSLISNVPTSYSRYAVIDADNLVAFITDVVEVDESGSPMSETIRLVPLTADCRVKSGTLRDASHKSGVRCSRGTFPVQLAVNSAFLDGSALFYLNCRAPMDVAYQEGKDLDVLKREEISAILQTGPKLALIQYKYHCPCIE